MLNWRQGIVVICLAGMEVCWLRPLLVFLVQGQANDALPPLAILVLILVAYWTSRVLIASRVRLSWARVLILSVAALSIVGASWFWRYDQYFPLDPAWIGSWLANLSRALSTLHQPDLIALLAGVYLWWRGITMSRIGQPFDRVFDSFRVGLVLLLLVSLAQSVTGWELQVLPYAFEFFLFGLAGMALARLNEIDESGQLRLRRDRYWLVILVTAIALVLGLGMASAMLFGVDVSGVLAAILGPIAWLFQVVVYIVLLMLGYLAQLLVSLIQVVFPPIPPGQPIESVATGLEASVTPVIMEPYGLPPAIEFGVKVFLGVGLALLLLYILARAIRRWQRAAPESPEEVHESIFSAAALGDDLNSWLRNLWNNLTVRRRRPGTGLPLLDENDPLYASFAIRRLYAELLAVAAAVGLDRAPGQTPYEYLPHLQVALPQHTDASVDFTVAYARARYDALRTTRADLEAARAAWDRLREDLRHLPPPTAAPETEKYTRDVDEMTELLVRGRPGA